MKFATNSLFTAALVCVTAVLGVGVAEARSAGDVAQAGVARYVIELEEPPLALYDGRVLPGPTGAGSVQMEATDIRLTGNPKLDARSPSARRYLDYLDQRFEAFRFEASQRLGRDLEPLHRYRAALNGFSAELSTEEVRVIAELPGVTAVRPDGISKLETFAGPTWLGADVLWEGSAGHPAAFGEGVIVGVIDSGINWAHPSFAAVGDDGYAHSNPLGSQLGLCSDPEVMCNDKLIGVYDMVVESGGAEKTKGRDNNGHGSHVAGIAVGNFVEFSPQSTVSGVAPHANLISYRVCYIGDPDDPQDDGCQNTAIISAIDQAITDGVDVINYSIGTDSFNPWSTASVPRTFLNAINAGIFVVTSAGNAGPGDGTIGSPADAPWVVAAGDSRHNQFPLNILFNLGGTGTPPDDIFGFGFTDGTDQRPIVYAGDFGSPLCGTGPSENKSTCGELTGASNPFAPGTFNGEIVVCDRGTYGRVEKGKNLLEAGAGGYVLANDQANGDLVNLDVHCLPGTHISHSDGQELKTWLASGGGHTGALTGLVPGTIPGTGDEIANSSSRGPNGSPVQDVLKPNVIAPGTGILSAGHVAQDFAVLSGTSMASPHIAGAAALLKSVHPSWTPAHIASAIESTAFDGFAHTAGNPQGSSTPHEHGTGRPRLNEAVNVGAYLNITHQDFLNANPALGGNPGNLNHVGLVNAACEGECIFTRRVTDVAGGGTWSVSTREFLPGINVVVSPSNFSLGAGASQTLTITVDVTGGGQLGTWVYGDIVLSSASSPDLVLPMAVFASGGALPSEWLIQTADPSGWIAFNIDDLAAMPDATFRSAGLVRPTQTTQSLPQDPTAENPFDGPPGTMTIWHDVPEGSLWLHAETLASTSVDVDLFVGRDANGNGVAEASEQVCQSTTPDDLELCDIFAPVPGEWWVVVQNWDNGLAQDSVTAVSFVTAPGADQPLAASGDGIIPEGAVSEVRLSWQDVDAKTGEVLYGAVGIGTDRNNPNNVGVVPVRYSRTGIEPPETLPLKPGREHGFALAGNTSWDKAFIDVPPGVQAVSFNVQGASGSENQALTLDLYHVPFGEALEPANVPFVQAPAGAPTQSTSGTIGSGPQATVNSPAEGRWFAVVRNASGNPASVRLTATLSHDSKFAVHRGLWDFLRGGQGVIAQGVEWQQAAGFNFILWYTYDELGQPSWYIASAAESSGNVWTADLLRVTNDGSDQQEMPVGQVVVTFLSDTQAIFSYTLFGFSGTDPMAPNAAPNTCPNIGGVRNWTGHWYRGAAGLGGATVLAYALAQAQVHYFFDDDGVPRWLIAADDGNSSPGNTVIPLLQFKGFCAVCPGMPVSFQEVGSVERNFGTDSTGSWTLDFSLAPPLQQNITRTDSITKLSDALICQ